MDWFSKIFSIDELRISALVICLFAIITTCIVYLFLTGDIPSNLMSLAEWVIGAVAGVAGVSIFSNRSNNSNNNYTQNSTQLSSENSNINYTNVDRNVTNVTESEHKV